MMNNGYVICLLKYIIGNGRYELGSWDTMSENKRPVSLGYFGRVDAVRVEQFRDYMDIASTHNAGFTGNRKQLMLYPLGTTAFEQIRFQEYKESDAECLPFQSADGRRPCFCCLSILNIDQAVKQQVCGTDYPQGIRKIAGQISAQIDAYAHGDEDGTEVWLPYEVMGLLGTEDLCVIFLSDSFDAIYNGINRLRRLETEGGIRVLDNSHSIMVVDFSGRAEKPKWGNATAELHFSLKSANGLNYIRKVQDAIVQYGGDQDVVLESQIGEYDATIRCPAALLGDYLYGYGRMLNYVTASYRTAAYQSETLLFKNIDTADEKPIRVPLDAAPVDGSLQFGEDLAGKMVEPVRGTIKKICQCLEDPEDIERGRQGTNSSYVSQVLHRLLKDFMRTVSIPVGGMFQYDLSIQFQVAINAIDHIAQIYAAERESNNLAQRNFDENFSQIVEAMSKSMQAASQIDRFRFEEQQSHIQNTGAYHKVLLAYYGIVKAILGLVYKVPRSSSSRQAVLIPLLSFGHTQIIYSNHFNSFYPDATDGKLVPAKLICITLPYQALSNIPKYIGPLTHEIFHYSSPADRKSRNEEAGRCLTAIAFRCFLDQLAGGAGQFGLYIFNRYRRAFRGTVNEIFSVIQENLENGYRAYIKGHPDDELSISLDHIFQGVKAALTPSFSSQMEDSTMMLYLNGWTTLRSKLKVLKRLDDTVAAAFMLKPYQDEKKALDHIKQAYQLRSGPMAQTIKAFLSAYETFLREIPPDLFDVGCTMHDELSDVKARQYLWQVHSIRSDKLYYNGRLRVGEDSATIDGNSLRFGAVLDHLIFGSFDNSSIATFGTRRNQIEEKLKSWYRDNGVQAQEQKKNREAMLDYRKYSTESLFANLMIRDNIERVDMQVDRLTADPGAKEIMRRLSGFYREYYKILDSEDEAKQISDQFNLNIRIIECYQYQPALFELCQTCINAPVLAEMDGKKPAAPSAIYRSYECETEVFDPSELSRAVTDVYEIMRPNDPTAPLWFRGQSDRDWSLLPNIMRPIKHKDGKESVDTDGFLLGMRKMLTLAQAKILPQGERYHKAEWLALLQHHDFKTTLLDWSENFHSALYFAVEPWGDSKEEPEKNASVRVLNPILYNLAKDMLEKGQKKHRGDNARESYDLSVERLRCYLMNERDKGEEYAIPLFAGGQSEKKYRCYFDLSIARGGDKGSVKLPIAAMTPSTSDRMKMQAGVFTFCDVRAKPQRKDGTWSYSDNDISNIQRQYFTKASKIFAADVNIRPFLFNIVLNCNNYKEFVQYLRAIGMRKYRMYPELTNLAKDIMAQSF